jgi:hypothetical protein
MSSRRDGLLIGDTIRTSVLHVNPFDLDKRVPSEESAMLLSQNSAPPVLIDSEGFRNRI